MVLPIDLSKFQKATMKTALNASFGFSDPDTWISTGSYALNYLISSDFNKGIPLGKVSIISGEPASGKSFVASGNVVKNAQDMGIFVVLIDTERALDEEWLRALGVDTSPEKLLKVNMAMVDDVARLVSDFMKMYKEEIKDKPQDQIQQVLIVLDSLGMLLTPTDVQQFEAGDMKGDMGRKPKALAALIRNCVNLLGSHAVGLLCTNHVYASQDRFHPDNVISGGSMQVYAASILVEMQKYKLKEDEDGNKTTTVPGIRAKAKVQKSRFSKPFEEIEVRITWEKGLDPYSGLIDLFEGKGLLAKDGNKLKYTDLSNVEHKYFRKNIPESLLDLMMNEFEQQEDSRRTLNLMGSTEEKKETVDE